MSEPGSIPATERPELAVFMEPPYKVFNQDRFFVSTPESDPNGLLRPIAELRTRLEAAGAVVHTADRLHSGEVRAKRNLYYTFGPLEHVSAMRKMPDVELRGFFYLEPPVVWPQIYRALGRITRDFGRVYIFNTVGDGYRLPGPQAQTKLQAFRASAPFSEVQEPYWSRRERQGLILVNSNKVPASFRNELYSERIRCVAHFGPRGKLDLYGMDWADPIGALFEGGCRRGDPWLLSLARLVKRGILPAYFRHRKAVVAAYRGPVPDKLEAMSRYRFAVCFENVIMKGCITEKIFDALYAGTIPIYLGAPDILDWIPGDCFIDMRHFPTYDALERHLDSLTTAQLEGYREAGKAFLASERFRPFSIDEMADAILADIRDEQPVGARPALQS